MRRIRAAAAKGNFDLLSDNPRNSWDLWKQLPQNGWPSLIHQYCHRFYRNLYKSLEWLPVIIDLSWQTWEFRLQGNWTDGYVVLMTASNQNALFSQLYHCQIFLIIMVEMSENNTIDDKAEEILPVFHRV